MAQHGQMSFRDNLAQLLRARFPVLYIESFEEARVLSEIDAVTSDVQLTRTERPIHVWSGTRGLAGPDGVAIAGTTEPAQVLDWMLRNDRPGVFILLDLHAHLGDDRRPADPNVLRQLREIAHAFQSGTSPRTLIIIAPVRRIPIELEKDVTLLDFPLPTEVQIRSVLDQMIVTNTANNSRLRIEVDDIGRERLAKAALGLTLNEASNAFARAMVNDGTLSDEDVSVVTEEKKQTVRKAGILEFVDADVDLDAVGGLQNLKRWLAKRNNSWLDEAAAYKIPPPKGVLMTGVPGCGKSLTAKAIAAGWELPLLRLDVGKVFAGVVGSSEQNMRSAIKTAEAASPCILWLDEIEKGFSGIGGSGDSGTSSRVFGTFLTWMQEKTATVFVIATANKVDGLPPEFLRKGRFDEIFFVDLPTDSERRDIWRLHLEKRLANSKGGGLPVTDVLLERLSQETEGFAGAEIEQLVIVGLFDAFSERRTMTDEDLFRAVRNMVPLSQTQAEQIAAVRAWAADRAIAATSPEDLTGYTTAETADPSGPPRLGAPSGQPSVVPPRDGMSRGGRMVDF